MNRINRRDFLRLAGGSALAAGTFGFPGLLLANTRKVVVVGGGVGGCTAAKYLRKLDPTLDVTLVEPKTHYTSCFMSNEVLSGDRSIESITFSYADLKDRYGVNVITDSAVGIDPIAKEVRTADGARLAYDACVVSPGVDFKWETIEGYDAQVAETIPHAWFAGPQTVTLRNQLLAMPDGGSVVIVAPPNPYKCPPGPYERASQIAMYCKHHKPKSKILILDPKAKFSKAGLFKQGWAQHYGFETDNSMIEWVGAEQGGKVSAVDAASGTVKAEGGDFHGDVINIIPPQKAGKIAHDADLVENDWCPVDKRTFESTRHPGIYVLGDASSASKMPKSAYAANSQAKVAVAAILARFAGQEPGEPTYVNTCYSIIAEEHGISVAAVYRLSEDGKVIDSIDGSGGLSPMDASAEHRKREVTYAHSWFRNVIDDMMQ
ncbi:MAG: FCSD flavin-binding domain-containing protein [Gammaproteobacteria bacterium]|nr:FCSD flavin-binding domain-containing protein [Gammaproteobacteria bacterium]